MSQCCITPLCNFAENSRGDQAKQIPGGSGRIPLPQPAFSTNPHPSQCNSMARILEKQNRLQMSQVFPLRYIDEPMGLAFQGFYERDRGTGKTAELPHRLYMRPQTKRPDVARCARGISRSFNSQQNRSRMSEAASPRCCSRPFYTLHLAGLRCGLARLRICEQCRLRNFKRTIQQQTSLDLLV